MQNHVDKRRKKKGGGGLTAIENFTSYLPHSTWKKQPLLHSTDIIFVLYVTQWFSSHLIQKITVTYEFRSSASGSKDEIFYFKFQYFIGYKKKLFLEFVVSIPTQTHRRLPHSTMILLYYLY
jgi:hypothetical protein